ncbi:MAG: gliding motility protein GldM [Bacteroidetes bacterium]|nr:gliding motility protein GldM [Bacteroidota bacterium]
MASGKLSPRQKMINMMYLVLIALLALNVSKEIIKAFNLMENSLDKSSINITKKNKAVMEFLDRQVAEKNEAASRAKAVADDISKTAKTLYDAIDKIKKELEDRTGGRKTEKEAILVEGGKPELKSGDGMEEHARYFIKENGGNRGKEFQKLVNDTREKLIKFLDDPRIANTPEMKELLAGKKAAIIKNTSLFAKDGKNSDGTPETWVSMYLEHSPLAGVMAILSKVENDCRNLETELLQTTAETVGALDFKFDQIQAVISAPTSAVFTGQTYEADIIMAAYNSKANMTMTVNGSPIEVKDGVGKYKVTPQTVGENSYKVSISVPKPGGGVDVKTAEGKFLGMASFASISADQLNVFYVGLDNPITVAVPGVAQSQVHVSVSGGGAQLVPGPGQGKYFVKIPVRNGNECTVNVTATLPDKRVVNMGSKLFKVRNVPRPTFRAGALSFDKPMGLAQLSAQSTAAAVLDNFIYDGVKYVVTGYTFIGIGRQGPKKAVSPNASLQPIKGILSGLRPGEFVMFTDIRAVGPGGQQVYLENASTTLQ